MAKILYANGCSWTFGNGINEDPNFNGTGNYSKDLKTVHNTYTWPIVLSKKLLCHCINESKGGGSNKRMVRKTCDFLIKCPKDQYKDLIVIIGWTTTERNEIHYREMDKWLTFNARQQFSTNYPSIGLKEDYKNMVDEYQKSYIACVYSETENLTNYVHQKFMLSNLLENLGVKYIFFNSLSPLPDYEPEYNYKADLERIKTKNMITEFTFVEYCLSNNISLSKCVHPMIEGHKAWAEKLYDKLLLLYGDQL